MQGYCGWVYRTINTQYPSLHTLSTRASSVAEAVTVYCDYRGGNGKPVSMSIVVRDPERVGSRPTCLLYLTLTQMLRLLHI